MLDLYTATANLTNFHISPVCISGLTKADMIVEMQKIKMDNQKLASDNQGMLQNLLQ
jgi:hypothetical protein